MSLFPTGVARPTVTDGLDWIYRAVTAFDRPVNACPSLHAALAVFTTMWFGRLCHTSPRLPLRRPGAWVAGMWLWTIAIFYAAVATRQHVVVDLIAGSALGALAYGATTFEARPKGMMTR